MIMKVKFFKSADKLREWFIKNHSDSTEIWVRFYKKSSGKKALTYEEVLDQALCFGWIDGIMKSIDELSYANRFTPRRARSNWSETNIKRVTELMELGLMHESGLKAFKARDEKR